MGVKALDFFATDLQDLYRAAKALAKRRGGVLTPHHMLLALLEIYELECPIKEKLQTFLDRRFGRARSAKVRIPKETQEVFVKALEIAKASGSDFARIEHFIDACRELGLEGVSKAELSKLKTEYLAALKKHVKVKVAVPEALLKYGRNLTELALSPASMPVIDREKEISAVIETLCRRIKNNPLLIGKAGVGKTAIVRAVAGRLGLGQVPERLKGKIIFEILRSNLVSGAAYYGEIEKRVKEIVETVKANPDIILFIDEIHTIIAAGGKEGLGDVANLLKAALGSGEITVIGATTTEEYYRYFAQDEALARRFNAILVDEPSPEDTLLILRGLKPDFERFHGVKIPDEVLEEIVRLTDVFIPQRSFPDKAIDLLDRALAKAAIRGEDALSVDLVSATIAEMSGLSPKVIRRDPKEFYAHLADYLKRRVVGQDEAAEQIARIIKIAKLRLDLKPERPDGVFAFVGPPGVGKREMALAIAEYVYGSEDKLIEFDMSQFTEDHHISRLIGSPPGYVGYGERGMLVKAAQDNPHSVLYFRNLDLAHPSIASFLAQVFADGRFVDAAGRLVSLSTCTVIITMSGVGYSVSRRKAVGFIKDQEAGELTVRLNPTLEELAPSLDAIVLFRPLSLEHLEEIARRKLRRHFHELQEKFGLEVEFSEELVKLIAKRAQESGNFGDEVVSIIETEIMDKLVELVLAEGVRKAKVSVKKGEISVEAAKG